MFYVLLYMQVMCLCQIKHVLYRNIDQILMNSLHGLLICYIGGLDCRVITTEYRTRAHGIHMSHLFHNAFVHVVYSVVSAQYSYTIHVCDFRL